MQPPCVGASAASAIRYIPQGAGSSNQGSNNSQGHPECSPQNRHLIEHKKYLHVAFDRQGLVSKPLKFLPIVEGLFNGLGDFLLHGPLTLSSISERKRCEAGTTPLQARPPNGDFLATTLLEYRSPEFLNTTSDLGNEACRSFHLTLASVETRCYQVTALALRPVLPLKSLEYCNGAQ